MNEIVHSPDAQPCKMHSLTEGGRTQFNLIESNSAVQAVLQTLAPRMFAGGNFAERQLVSSSYAIIDNGQGHISLYGRHTFADGGPAFATIHNIIETFEMDYSDLYDDDLDPRRGFDLEARTGGDNYQSVRLTEESELLAIEAMMLAERDDVPFRMNGGKN